MNNNFLSRSNNNNYMDRSFINNNTRNIRKKDNVNNINNTDSSFVDNKETFNQRIFDRNILNAQLSSTVNERPTYFSEDYINNRETSEKIFENRFENNIYNIHSHPRIGTVDFSTLNRNDARVEFKKNYNDYIKKD